MTATVTALRTVREQVALDLAANRRHVVNVLRYPEPEIHSAPVGDVLCWADGLDEASVSRVLRASGINWGRRLSLLSAKEMAALCYQIKTREPEAWERWRVELASRRAAA